MEVAERSHIVLPAKAANGRRELGPAGIVKYREILWSPMVVPQAKGFAGCRGPSQPGQLLLSWEDALQPFLPVSQDSQPLAAHPGPVENQPGMLQRR